MRHPITNIIALALALTIAAGIIGCGGSEPAKSKRRSTGASKTTKSDEPAKTEPAKTSTASSSEPAKASSTASGNWGTLKGKFVYDGTAPEPAKVDVNKDQEVCGKHGLVNEALLVDKDGGIANVVIYVRSKGVKAHPDLTSDKSPVKIDNKDCRFEPHVTVYDVSRPLLLHNSDPVAHNMNLTIAGDNSTNQLLQPNDGIEHKLNLAKPVGAPIACNIHPWMNGWLLPRDNPYFAVSAKDGTFEIKNLPTGELEFQVWHEKSGYVSAGDWQRGRFKLEIKPGDNALGDGGVVKVDPKLFEKQ